MRSDELNILALCVPVPLIEASDLLSKSVVLRKVRSFYDEPQSAVVLKKLCYCCSTKMLAQEYSTASTVKRAGIN